MIVVLYVVGPVAPTCGWCGPPRPACSACGSALFDHIHKLSMAEHTEQRRGALVARVTSDIETLAQFIEWGAVAWIVDSVLIVGTFAVMAVYDWRLALLTLVVLRPLPLVLLPILQRRQLAAQDQVRTAVGDIAVGGVRDDHAARRSIQAYGLEGAGPGAAAGGDRPPVPAAPAGGPVLRRRCSRSATCSASLALAGRASAPA